jgi:hypothetical protein
METRPCPAFFDLQYSLGGHVTPSHDLESFPRRRLRTAVFYDMLVFAVVSAVTRLSILKTSRHLNTTCVALMQ